MPTLAEYRYCARIGMRQAEAARHLGVSRAAVAKAAARYGLAFGAIGLDFTRGRKLAMQHNRYPWHEMEIGDWIEAECDAYSLARSATQRLNGRVFRGVTRAHVNRVVRVA